MKLVLQYFRNKKTGDRMEYPVRTDLSAYLFVERD